MSAATWPWQPATIRVFLSAVFLPILLWAIQQVLDRFLEFINAGGEIELWVAVRHFRRVGLCAPLADHSHVHEGDPLEILGFLDPREGRLWSCFGWAFY